MSQSAERAGCGLQAVLQQQKSAPKDSCIRQTLLIVPARQSPTPPYLIAKFQGSGSFKAPPPAPGKKTCLISSNLLAHANDKKA